MRQVDCPYCGKPARRASAADVYGADKSASFSERVFWQCQPCDAYVGTHPGTDAPLGTLANRGLRRLRVQVHALLDPLWRGSPDKRMRTVAYAFLARRLGITERNCHVGLFDEALCERALSALRGVTVESLSAPIDSGRTRKAGES